MLIYQIAYVIKREGERIFFFLKVGGGLAQHTYEKFNPASDRGPQGGLSD
jgi:hypothetical protein